MHYLIKLLPRYHRHHHHHHDKDEEDEDEDDDDDDVQLREEHVQVGKTVDALLQLSSERKIIFLVPYARIVIKHKSQRHLWFPAVP